ncbi:response regulator transcription factor [Methylobacterium sp. 77]|uniref:response regulator n=1 Tax=Methylobacterium sp. 77 TaxID=1101192 RepID=UPI00047AE0C6|nr:response regulator transcription factor [Methylobacterium sp. 77]
MADAVGGLLKLLIADGYPLCLCGVRAMVRDGDSYEIIHEASSGAEALRLIIAQQPDIAILDMAMSGMQGFTVLRRIKAEAPDTRVIIFSSFEDASLVRETLAEGACGYVLKRSAPEHLLQALNAVRSGGLYIDPTIASHFVTDKRRIGTRGAMPLTEREREVFRLIALGFTNKEVAGKLGVTAKSIETYKNRASEKLDIRSRAKIVQYAMLQGWLIGPPS